MYITTNRVERNKQVQVLAALTSVLLLVSKRLGEDGLVG
jgi:hypothetical protein